MPIEGLKPWRMVPVEPTEAMHEAANREWDGRMSARSAGVWQAMLNAAPHPTPTAADTGLVERLTKRNQELELLFHGCQLARDSAGFVGSVPECIQYFEAESDAYKQCAEDWKKQAEAAEQREAAAREQIAGAIEKCAAIFARWPDTSARIELGVVIAALTLAGETNDGQ